MRVYKPFSVPILGLAGLIATALLFTHPGLPMCLQPSLYFPQRQPLCSLNLTTAKVPSSFSLLIFICVGPIRVYKEEIYRFVSRKLISHQVTGAAF
jgi:hypothetical protein